MGHYGSQRCGSKEIGRDLVKDIEFWDLALGKAAVVSECNAREVQEYAALLNQIGAPLACTARMQRASGGRAIDRASAGRGGGSETAAEHRESHPSEQRGI